jgi:GNAT superfamily N-acetyltransferase
VSITIQPASRDDIAATVELLYEIDRYYGDNSNETPEHRAAQIERLILGDHPVAHLLLAKTDDGTAIGLAAYSYLWPARGATHSLYLKELYVRAEHRHTGAGRALMTHLAQIATDAGCSRIEWTADEDNPTAQHFYATLGAKPHAGKLHYRLSADELSVSQAAWRQTRRADRPSAD